MRNEPAARSVEFPWLRANLRLLILLAVLAAAILAATVVRRADSRPVRVSPLDPVPAAFEGGSCERRGPQVVLRLSGSPEEMGRQHGTLARQGIRFMLERYVFDHVAGSRDVNSPGLDRLLDAVRVMRASLPEAYIRELDACAAAAAVDPDVLLLAQCEGDVVHAAGRASRAASEACSAYVAFGPATADGSLEAGRNLDYYVGVDVPRRCALVTYYRPREGEGHAFVAVGMTGILGGGTLVNEHGLMVANHLGGGSASRINAIPTLILMRLVAQNASTVEEGIAIIRDAKRMRGQIIWMAQEADVKTGRAARAVAVLYDAEKVETHEAEAGVLIVTNPVFGAEPEKCRRYRSLRKLIDERYGKLDGQDALTTHGGVTQPSTIQIVQAQPGAGLLRVWHGTVPAQRGESVAYPMPGFQD